MGGLQLITPAASGAVTLQEAKDYLRLSDAANDGFLQSAIQAVSLRFESFTRRALVAQAWDLWLDSPPEEAILEIPKPPLQSVTFIKSYGADNTATVFDAANYTADLVSVPGRVVLNSGAAWPSAVRGFNSIQIRFAAGYADASQVPSDIKQGALHWLKLLAAGKSRLFESDENSAALGELSRAEIPPAVRGFWDAYRLIRVRI